MKANIIRMETPDNLRLDGILYQPEYKTNKVIIHVHGTSSDFYRTRYFETLSAEYTKNGYAFLTFNNRGSGNGYSFIQEKNGKRIGGVVIGSQNEIFEDCVIDIQTAIDFARKQGFNEIVLQGHSYGCNKVTYYALEKKCDGKIILLAPCDVADISRPTSKDKVRDWKANNPENLNMFRYKDKTFMSALSKIKNNILVEIGTADEYISQENKQECIDYLVTAFKNAKVTGHLIKDGDKLMSLRDGATILNFTYDAIGNPTLYKNNAMTWDFRNLASYKGATFTYNATGLRTSKAVSSVTTDYIWADGKLLREKTASNTIDFIYGVDGIIGFKRNGTQYWYVKNLQGDVVEIRDNNGVLKAKYEYDAWGNCTIVENVGGIAEVNPIRYRSYYFDSTVGLYYLQSRWYDPQTGRFVNADDISILDESQHMINGLNLYSYCGNNAVMNVDPSGQAWWKWLVGGLVIVGLGIAVIATGGAAAGVAGFIVAGAFKGAVIGAVSGALIGGTIGGIVSAVNGDGFWSGFWDGAASGFMVVFLGLAEEKCRQFSPN